MPFKTTLKPFAVSALKAPKPLGGLVVYGAGPFLHQPGAQTLR